MFDTKVVFAVFLTLLVVAVFMTTPGTIDLTDNETNTPPEIETENTGIPTSLSELINLFTEQPEPDTQIIAELQTTDLEEKQIPVETANITGSNMTKIQADDSNIESNQPIKIHNATGTVQINPTNIDVRATGYSTPQLQTTTNTRITTEKQQENINITENTKINLEFNQAQGEIITPEQSVTVNSTININTFTGNLELYPLNNTIKLDGQLHNLEADEITIN